MIRYLYSAEGITADQLPGFFEGWPNPPSPETHLRLLTKSDEVILAMDTQIWLIIAAIFSTLILNTQFNVTDETIAGFNRTLGPWQSVL